MGYCYDRATGRRICDRCGTDQGVRLRTCPYKVLGTSFRSSDGQRHALPYCPAPALCSGCHKEMGGLRGVHGHRCAEGAAAAQAEHDETERQYQSGAFMVCAAFGSWHAAVPDGKAGVLFRNKAGVEAFYLLDSDDYDGGHRRVLDAYPTAVLAEGVVIA